MGDELLVEVCGKNGAYYKVSDPNNITKMFRNINWTINVIIDRLGDVFVLNWRSKVQCIFWSRCPLIIK